MSRAIEVQIVPRRNGHRVCSGCDQVRPGYDHVYEAVKYAVSWGLQRRDLDHIESIGIDEVQWHKGAAEVKQLKADGYEPILKGARWLLLKRPENLTDKQAVKMNELFQYNLKSIRSHLMKEDFQRFWEYHSPYWAGRFLDQWCTRAMLSKIEPMKKVARSIREKRELILNWFRAGGTISAGIVEGFNNKLKLISNMAFVPKSLRNRPLSQPWSPTRARIHPQILLRRLFLADCARDLRIRS